MAHASVREAINLLIAEGFLVNDAGASARVVTYREQDVTHVHEVRQATKGVDRRPAESPADAASDPRG